MKLNRSFFILILFLVSNALGARINLGEKDPSGPYKFIKCPDDKPKIKNLCALAVKDPHKIANSDNYDTHLGYFLLDECNQNSRCDDDFGVTDKEYKCTERKRNTDITERNQPIAIGKGTATNCKSGYYKMDGKKCEKYRKKGEFCDNNYKCEIGTYCAIHANENYATCHEYGTFGIGKPVDFKNHDKTTPGSFDEIYCETGYLHNAQKTSGKVCAKITKLTDNCKSTPATCKYTVIADETIEDLTCTCEEYYVYGQKNPVKKPSVNPVRHVLWEKYLKAINKLDRGSYKPKQGESHTDYSFDIEKKYVMWKNHLELINRELIDSDGKVNKDNECEFNWVIHNAKDYTTRFP